MSNRAARSSGILCFGSERHLTLYMLVESMTLLQQLSPSGKVHYLYIDSNIFVQALEYFGSGSIV
jgi:hypothetical protein